MPNFPDAHFTLPIAKTHTLSLANTALGWIGIERYENCLRRLYFDLPTESSLMQAVRQARAADGFLADSLELRSAEEDELHGRLADFTLGVADDFLDVQIDVRHLTPFAQKVVDACRQIPLGQTRTYAELAAAAGSPQAARAVGNVMAGNRIPIIVPCHRVVGSGGSLGGYSATGGLRTKRRLLELEAAMA